MKAGLGRPFAERLGPPLADRPGRGSGGPFGGTGGAGTWINEDWSGAGGSLAPLTYRDTTPAVALSWSRALAIDNNGDSRVDPADPLPTGEVVDGASVGAEIITFAGRKVLDLWCEGAAGRSLGAKVPLVVDNWKYEAFAPYAGEIVYFRYFTFVPELNLQTAGGSWLTLGTQVKTTELYGGAGYQQNVEPDGAGGWRWFSVHLDPTGGANTVIKQTTTEPQVEVLEGVWQQHDLAIGMHSTAGFIRHWIDGTLVFESEGIMGDDAGASLDAANFYVLLYGDFWTGERQHLYIGDVIVSPTPITGGNTPGDGYGEETMPEPPPPEESGIIQSAFRIRNDDGTEATATWRAAENTNTNVPFGKWRLRFQVRNTGASEVTKTYRLQQNINGGGWADVPVDSTGYRITGSDVMNWGDAFNARLTSPPSGSFTANVFNEGGQTSTSITIAAGNYTEFEFGLAFFDWAGAVNGAQVQYRLVDHTGAALLDGYTHTPTVTAGS